MATGDPRNARTSDFSVQPSLMAATWVSIASQLHSIVKNHQGKEGMDEGLEEVPQLVDSQEDADDVPDLVGADEERQNVEKRVPITIVTGTYRHEQSGRSLS